MKRFIILITAMLTLVVVSANAMSYSKAREQALFLTDKMAYELNLTDDQYEAAYEINLDYLMRINDYDDVYSTYWRNRNLDLSYVLLDWQYERFINALYFYRPIYWDAGYWRFRVYARYPHRDYYYFGRPAFYTVYRGSHSWYNNGGRSWYRNRTFGNGPRRDGVFFGLRDSYRRGDFGNGVRGLHTTSASRISQRGIQSFGGRSKVETFDGRRSSTRQTVTLPNNNGARYGNSHSFGGRSNATMDSRIERNTVRTTPRNTFSPDNNNRSGNSSSSGSFGGRSGGFNHSSSSSFGSGNNSSRNGSFGSGSSSSRSGSFGGGNRPSGGSFGGGSHSSGGGSFGGRR